MRSGALDAHQLQQVVRKVLGRWISRELRRRPMVIPMIVMV
jgi:ribonuclease J